MLTAIVPLPAPPGVGPLPHAALYRRCDLSGLPFATTAELEAADGTVGQERAVDAIGMGLGLRRKGYNIFAVGSPGTGKKTIIDRLTRERARSEPAPADRAYVNNFVDPDKPRALALPPGRGTLLRQDMRTLVDELRTALPAAFESDDYRSRRQAIDNLFKQQQQEAFSKVEEHAKERSIGILRTPLGLGLAPLRNGEVMPKEEFEKLPEDDQKRIQDGMSEIHAELELVMQQGPKAEGERRDKLKELNEEVTRFAIGFRLEGLKRRYADLPAVVDYLQTVERDLAENTEPFLMQGEADQEGMAGPSARRRGSHVGHFDRYQVNLIVDHAARPGAPVIEEDHPTLQNLIGRVEYRSEYGSLVTDFTMIKPGALHEANGGYLVLDARRVLLQPFAWEELKRTLRAGEIQIRSVPDLLGVASAMTLQPEAIPLAVKVILTGDHYLYYLLASLDPDFREMFKIAADFNDDLPRDATTERSFAQLLGSIARDESLRPLDREAVARLIEQGARLAGDAEKMTAQVEVIADLVREADHLAEIAGREAIGLSEISQAIDLQIRRASRLRERLQEEIHRGTILIDTKGVRVGQVNGLSVLQLAGFMFGRPSRISARVRLGKGEVVDIEREVELGGPIHSKGVMILAGFLGGRFGRERPLALSVSLVFEQSYGGVEGDSASMGELCAILSALADQPIRQGIAITGSVNQNGDAQAIGGVNEKIEGFFDVCRDTGLDGQQGVVIPASNVKHLMLRADVVKAVEEGRFSVFAVSSVDQAMAVLTGVEAGSSDEAGHFPDGSVNRRIETQLDAMAERVRRFNAREQAVAGHASR